MAKMPLEVTLREFLGGILACATVIAITVLAGYYLGLLGAAGINVLLLFAAYFSAPREYTACGCSGDVHDDPSCSRYGTKDQ